MTKVVALQTWSNGTITMDEKSVLDIEDALASDLIAKGIVADAATYFGGGSGGGVDVEIVKCVSGSPNTCDHTYAQLKSAYEAGKVLYCEATKSDIKYCGWLSWQENAYVGVFWMYIHEASSSQQTKVAIAKDDSVTIASA